MLSNIGTVKLTWPKKGQYVLGGQPRRNETLQLRDGHISWSGGFQCRAKSASKIPVEHCVQINISTKVFGFC